MVYHSMRRKVFELHQLLDFAIVRQVLAGTEEHAQMSFRWTGRAIVMPMDPT
jgi:hypothetical protein